MIAAAHLVSQRSANRCRPQPIREPPGRDREAFAAIVVALIGELGLPEDIVNFEGGMIVHGLRIG